MEVRSISEAQSDDYDLDLTNLKPNSNAATAAGLGIPLNRHQITVIMAGDANAIEVTLTAKPTGCSAYESVTDGVLSIIGGTQKTVVIRDCSLDAIKITTGVLVDNTYTVRYIGTGDYSEGR